MTALPVIPVCLAMSCGAIAAPAAKPMQPPMNSFDFAFYTCDDGKAFQVSYDSDTPTVATINTSNKQYVLNRQPADDGAKFTKGAARFWTDGRKVEIEGTATRLQNCRRKAN